MSKRIVRGFIAAASVLCGVIVGVLTNVLTNKWSWTLVGGMVVIVPCWMALEVWRSAHEADSRSEVTVTQHVRSVLGRLVGAQTADQDHAIRVRQQIWTIEVDGEAVGYDATRHDKRHGDGSF